jgi:hypothetical protein
MDEFLPSILTYGLPITFLLIFVFLIIQDPTRAFKLQTLLITPFYRLFKWFKREYISSQVAGAMSHFFTKVIDLSTESSQLKFKVSWVRNDDSPILKSGKLIIRMRKDDDQTKNILTATRYALTKLICPNFRQNINNTYATAIDYTFLHKLADRLGNHGKAIFRQHFLNPEMESNPNFIEILKKLLVLDKSGMYTSIFINELDHVGEGMFGDGDVTDRTDELVHFIEFLIKIAEREIGEEGKLVHFSELFKVSIILLAKAQIASKRGLFPYLRRLNINLEKGCDSIYILAFPPAFEFLNKFIKVVDGNQRVLIDRIYRLRELNSVDTKINVCCLRKNKLYSIDTFIKKIEASELKKGDIVEGVVIDSSTDLAIITFFGLDGVLNKIDASWNSFTSCSDLLAVGQSAKFLIKNIDFENGNISLSLKFENDDPWNSIDCPKLGEIIEFEVISIDAISVKGLYKHLLEVRIPLYDLNWNGEDYDRSIIDVGKQLKAIVIEIKEDERYLKCSYRHLESDPWPKIHESLLPGTFFNGRVHEIDENFVKVIIDNGLIGRVPSSSFIKAGYEYTNFMQNLIIGQVLQVVVTKVFIAKQWIRLDLKRNVN